MSDKSVAGQENGDPKQVTVLIPWYDWVAASSKSLSAEDAFQGAEPTEDTRAKVSRRQLFAARSAKTAWFLQFLSG